MVTSVVLTIPVVRSKGVQPTKRTLFPFRSHDGVFQAIANCNTSFLLFFGILVFAYVNH